MERLRFGIFFIFGVLIVFYGVGNIGAQAVQDGALPEGTSIALKSYNQIFLGWVDLNKEDWALHGYNSLEEWSTVIDSLNNAFQAICKNGFRYVPGKEITGALKKDDEGYKDKELYVAISNVRIDYDKYNLYLAIDFIDVKTRKVLYTIPQKKYYGSAWGFENYLRAALEEVNKTIKKVISTETVKITHSMRDFQSLEKQSSAPVQQPLDKQDGKFSSYINIFLGWIDFCQENWMLHGYNSQEDWTMVINRLNKAFQTKCRYNLDKKQVIGALSSEDNSFTGKDLFIKFSEVRIDYNKYNLYLTVDFIDLKTGMVLLNIPNKSYRGKTWGFENYLTASLNEVNKAIQKVILSTQ